MSAIEIKLFDPRSATRADWTEFHAYRRMRAAEDDPDEPVQTDAEFEHGALRHWPLYENQRWIARLDGAIAGNLGFSFRRANTPDYAEFAPHVQGWGGVLQPWRRRGIATALLHQLLSFMGEADKTIADFGTHLPDGHAFLQAIGAELRHRGVENRLLFAGLDWDELECWHANAIPPCSGLYWEVHSGRIPEDRFVEIVPQFNALLADVPLGTLDTPPIRWEMESFRTYYEELDRHGGAHHLVLLMDGTEIAALCEANWDARYPDRVYQALTAVARPWRGKGLAKGVKAAMLRLIRERHPDVKLMITYNAEVNAAMLSINQRLGFRIYQRHGSYQISVETLATWLRGR